MPKKESPIRINTSSLHPWHGVSAGPDCPHIVTCYIEMVPTDVVKYELDKESGHLKVDRPQLYSSQCPSLYGFIPQTYCGSRVGAFSGKYAKIALGKGPSLAKGGSPLVGDRDPLDICVLSERPIIHGGLLLRAVPIGGLRIIDRNEADDKLIAVLYDDAVYGNWNNIEDCPKTLIDRLVHYFLSYKDIPGTDLRKVKLSGVYGRSEAHEVIRLSQLDYKTLIQVS